MRKLAAVLRVADALDREHTSRVHSLTASEQGGGVALHLATRGNPVLEEWALRKKGRMFETVFGTVLTVSTEPT